MKSPKYLFFDLGVRRAAAREGESLGRSRLGDLFEQFIGTELLKLIRHHPSRYRLSFWRDADGPEVDWVVVGSKKWIPIEVKLQSNPGLAATRHLQTFMREYPDRVSEAFILCTATKAYQITNGITALPWQELPQIL